MAAKAQKFPQVATVSRPKSSKNHNESSKNNGLGQDFKAKYQYNPPNMVSESGFWRIIEVFTYLKQDNTKKKSSR